MMITMVSPHSGQSNTMELDITPEQWAEWQRPAPQRRLVQEIFPNLSASEREFLMTGDRKSVV